MNEEALLKGDLLIRPLKRSRGPFCLELGFILPYSGHFCSPPHEEQGAIPACIFTELCVLFRAGQPPCRGEELRMNGMVCPRLARLKREWFCSSHVAPFLQPVTCTCLEAVMTLP